MAVNGLRKLGSTIVGHVAEADEARRCDHADYVAVIAAEHGGQELLDYPVVAEQVDAHGADELLLLAVDERLKRLHARVVHNDGHVAHVAAYALAHGAYLLATAQIAVVGVDALAAQTGRLEQLGRLVVLVAVDVEQDEYGASFSELV